jgi:hypothetical protein
MLPEPTRFPEEPESVYHSAVVLAIRLAGEDRRDIEPSPSRSQTRRIGALRAPGLPGKADGVTSSDRMPGGHDTRAGVA